MDLSIVIVNWNTRELLASCLRSVYATLGGLSCEVLVIDNASADDSVRMVRDAFRQVRLIENQGNEGFARANNRGIALAQGRYVLLLNSDTVIRSGALETLIAHMDAHPEVGACGPRLLNADGSFQPSCYPMLTPWREFWRLTFLNAAVPLATYPMARWDPHTPHAVDVISGACLLLRHTALEQVGALDERYFMYSEEMDLCYRLAAAGWRAHWVPQAEVVHYGGASSRQVAQSKYIQLYRSKLQFHRKTGGEGRARWFKLLLAFAYTPRFIVSSVGALLVPELAVRASTYRRLLVELPRM